MCWRDSSLQWSRASESAEGHHRRAHRGCRSIASTEPRFGKRGRIAPRSPASRSLSGFNGAALRKARKGRKPRICSTRSSVASTEPRFGKRGRPPPVFSSTAPEPGFNGAALRKARKAPELRAGVGSTNGFNGAALRKARKESEIMRRNSGEGVASTEPRFGKRGRVPSVGHIFACENASTEPRFGKRGRRLGSYTAALAKERLQRSRASESAEGAQIPAGILRAPVASTEPRFGKRGRHRVFQAFALRIGGFNGAALRKARKDAHDRAGCRAGCLASTEPRFGKRGRIRPPLE